MTRRRLGADRLRRIWALVEYIAQHPGCSRRDLARQFALSERQLQADLELVRREMALPLVRRQGYRFAQAQAAASVSLPELTLLGRALQHAAAAGVASSEAVQRLATHLPDVLPPHWRALGEAALARAAGGPSDGARDALLDALAQALSERTPLFVRYQPALGGPVWESTLEVELVLPLEQRLYLLGQCAERRRLLLIDFDAVLQARPALPAPAAT